MKRRCSNTRLDLLVVRFARLKVPCLSTNWRFRSGCDCCSPNPESNLLLTRIEVRRFVSRLLSFSITKGSSIVLDLIRDRLSDYTERFVNRTIPVREGLAFRELPSLVVVTASLTRSAFFHVGLVLAALLYLVALFALFEYLAKGKVDFKGLLADMTSKRTKK